MSLGVPFQNTQNFATPRESRSNDSLPPPRAEATVTEFAHANGFEDVFESYGASVILDVLLCFGNTRTIDNVFNTLREGVKARAELQDIERSMDNAYFEEIVTSGIFAFSGTDQSTGSPILWIDGG